MKLGILLCQIQLICILSHHLNNFLIDSNLVFHQNFSGTHLLNGNCGVYNPANSCRCNKRISTALSCGRMDKGKLNFADKIESYNNEMEELCSMSGIYKNHGNFRSNANFITQLNGMLATKGIIRDN